MGTFNVGTECKGVFKKSRFATNSGLQGRSQKFAKGAKQGVWETAVPQRGPGAKPPVGVRVKPPEAGDIPGADPGI